MTKTNLLGPWVRRFLLEYLVTELNLARNTQRSYRDTLSLLLPFTAQQVQKEVDEVSVIDVSPDLVRLFLRHLEESRKCAVATRNQRLAAIHSLARFVGLHSPEHIEWCGQLRTIPPKRAPRSTITYLEKSEMDALLSAPDQLTEQGRRDHALLLFLYNTGARADEAAQAKIVDLFLAHSSRDHSLVQVRGKGNKLRRCPLWPQTVAELSSLIASRPPTDHVFLNRCGQPITRFGIHTMVERYVRKISRSEEHTSELQSRLHLVCRLLLEKKKKSMIQVAWQLTARSRIVIEVDRQGVEIEHNDVWSNSVHSPNGLASVRRCTLLSDCDRDM